MADDSATTAALVAATSAAAASPSLPGGGRPHSDHHDAASFSATAALVAFLRMEADLAEEKARRLRAQATAMAIQFGVTDETQDAYGAYSVISTIDVLICCDKLGSTCTTCLSLCYAV